MQLEWDGFGIVAAAIHTLYISFLIDYLHEMIGWYA